MRVLMLSREYPPLVVGGLGRHVAALSNELAAAGHHVQVVTRGDRPAATDEVVSGVHVRRAARDPLAIDFTVESLLAEVEASEHSLLRAALPLLAETRPDIVHAHDWLVAQTALTLAEHTQTPLVATIHSTETGRNQGHLSSPVNVAIDSIERWLASRANALIVCSRPMRDEVAHAFDVAPSAVDVVPNGVDADGWRVPRDPAAEPLVVCVSRLVYEKGVQTLLAALPPLLARHPTARLAVSGTGPHAAALADQARALGVDRAVDWLGFVPDADLLSLLARAAVAVVPSLYEPFGITALEAAAAGVPSIVADTGGLRDLAAAGVATGTFPPGDAAALADAIAAILDDVPGSGAAAARAADIVRRNFGWPAVARRTAEIYARAARSRT